MSGKPTLPPRRDPRADEDDNAPPSAASRVDVVNMERAADPISQVANAMRRELAKLHHQAAAFERTVEDQRRERTDALERAERATEHALGAEARANRLEAEMQTLRRLHEGSNTELEKLRAERDELERRLGQMNRANEDLTRLKADFEKANTEREEAQRQAATFETEIAEIRKREHQEAAKVGDKDTEIAALREKLDRATAEGASASEEASKHKADVVKANQKIADLSGELTKTKDASERDRKTATEQIARLQKQLNEARAAQEKVVAVEKELSDAQKQLEEARAEVTRMVREIEAARHERDVNVERMAMVERDVVELRLNDERMRRQLDGALQAALHAETRANVAERAREMVEEGVRQLRDEITTAFARIRLVAPSLAPPPAEPLSARIAASVPPPREYTPSPGGTLTGSALPVVSPSQIPKAANTPAFDPRATLDYAQTPHSPGVVPKEASPASKSVPVPRPAPRVSVAPVTTATPMLFADEPMLFASDPPPAKGEEKGAPATRAATPGARRDELIAKLEEPNEARAAVDALRSAPAWLKGPPPRPFLEALAHADYDAQRPVMEVARVWDREPLCRAILDGLKSEADSRHREHAAWLLKHLAAPNAWKDIADLARSDSETTGVRRWLLEALDRLAAARNIGWTELGDLVRVLARHTDATLRDGTIGILRSLEPSEDKKKVLMDVVEHDDDEVVLTDALEALGALAPFGDVDLDDETIARLLGHASDRVQRAAKELMASTGTGSTQTIEIS